MGKLDLQEITALVRYAEILEQVEEGLGEPLFYGPVEEIKQLVLDLPSFETDHLCHSDRESGYHLDKPVEIDLLHDADETVLNYHSGLVPFTGVYDRHLAEDGPIGKYVKEDLTALGCQIGNLDSAMFQYVEIIVLRTLEITDLAFFDLAYAGIVVDHFNLISYMAEDIQILRYQSFVHSGDIEIHLSSILRGYVYIWKIIPLL